MEGLSNDRNDAAYWEARLASEGLAGMEVGSTLGDGAAPAPEQQGDDLVEFHGDLLAAEQPEEAARRDAHIAAEEAGERHFDSREG